MCIEIRVSPGVINIWLFQSLWDASNLMAKSSGTILANRQFALLHYTVKLCKTLQM